MDCYPSLRPKWFTVIRPRDRWLTWSNRALSTSLSVGLRSRILGDIHGSTHDEEKHDLTRRKKNDDTRQAPTKRLLPSSRQESSHWYVLILTIVRLERSGAASAAARNPADRTSVDVQTDNLGARGQMFGSGSKTINQTLTSYVFRPYRQMAAPDEERPYNVV